MRPAIRRGLCSGVKPVHEGSGGRAVTRRPSEAVPTEDILTEDSIVSAPLRRRRPCRRASRQLGASRSVGPLGGQTGKPRDSRCVGRMVSPGSLMPASIIMQNWLDRPGQSRRRPARHGSSAGLHSGGASAMNRLRPISAPSCGLGVVPARALTSKKWSVASGVGRESHLDRSTPLRRDSPDRAELNCVWLKSARRSAFGPACARAEDSPAEQFRRTRARIAAGVGLAFDREVWW